MNLSEALKTRELAAAAAVGSSCLLSREPMEVTVGRP